MTRQRNPNVAVWLSIIPGLGQLYNGQFAKALFFPVATFATLFSGVLLISSGDRLVHYRIGAIAALFVGLLAVVLFMALAELGLAFWASAAVDARRSAQALSEGRVLSGRWWLLRL